MAQAPRARRRDTAYGEQSISGHVKVISVAVISIAPMVRSLFKFIPRQYGKDLLQRATLQLNTLYRCREIEKAGPGRGDPGENTKHASHYVHGSYLSPDTHPPPPARGVVLSQCYVYGSYDGPDIPSGLVDQTFGPGMARQVYASQSMFDSRYDGPDMFVFCTTSFPRRCLQSRWRSPDGDDVWIEIFDPPAFFHALEQATRHLGQFHGVHQVRYGPRQTICGFFPEFVDPRWQAVPAAILKPPDFSIEREWRALWMPAALPIKPELIVAPELPKFCRLLRVVKSRDGCKAA